MKAGKTMSGKNRAGGFHPPDPHLPFPFLTILLPPKAAPIHPHPSLFFPNCLPRGGWAGSARAALPRPGETQSCAPELAPASASCQQ